MANTGIGQEVWTNEATGSVTSGGTTVVAAGTSQSWTVTATNAFPVASTSSLPPTFFYAADPVAPTELFLVNTCPGGTGVGQSWTVIRGANGTAPVSHIAGFTVTQVVSADTLSNLQSLPWFNVVTMFGADPTGVADCGAAVAAAIAALPATGAIIYFPAGQYVNAATTWTINLTATPEQVVRIQGDGMRTTKINYKGTGDCFRMYCSSTGALNYGGSGFRDICIDGTSSTGASCGVHIGDFELHEINQLQVTNFTGTSSIGIHYDNAYTWTEEGTCRMSLINNTTAVLFEVTTGYNSWGYSSFDFNIWMHANQDGVSLKNGPVIYHGTMRIRGNTDSSASAMTNAVIRMNGLTQAGSAGGAGLACLIHGMELIVQIEQASVNANVATTIIMDSTSAIEGCFGMLDFSYGGAAYTPAVLNRGQFGFTGVISGDTGLCPAAAYDLYAWTTTNLPTIYNAGTPGGLYGYSGSGFPTVLGDMFTWTLSASITANLTSTFYNGTKTLGAPQRVTIVIKQAASGGPYTVTWPNPGSPTVSAPAIKWPGGTAPTMTATANAVDVYDLETLDGVTWYGVAHQNVS